MVAIIVDQGSDINLSVTGQAFDQPTCPSAIRVSPIIIALFDSGTRQMGAFAQRLEPAVNSFYGKSAKLEWVAGFGEKFNWNLIEIGTGDGRGDTGISIYHQSKHGE